MKTKTKPTINASAPRIASSPLSAARSPATPPLSASINRSHWRAGFALLLVALAAVWFALLPTAVRAEDGDLGNGNTAEGKSALASLTTGQNNTAIGFKALYSVTTATGNTATGRLALANNTGGFNTADGTRALLSNTTGGYNTATGREALFSNTTGSFNTAAGVDALHDNTTGFSNTATGSGALFGNTTGYFNTATGGGGTLHDNTTGNFNTATGGATLAANTTGQRNTATGSLALFVSTTGSRNTADGTDALTNNTTGNFNTATGDAALYDNTTGETNTGIGNGALFSNTTGQSNIGLGVGAGSELTTGNDNIDIGNDGVAGESDVIRIGTPGTQTNTFIAGISGTTVAGGVTVIIDANGHLGTVTSSERFKDQIKPMDKASEAILALKPVTFRYKHELDPDAIPQFGLVAEQVEKVDPDLVTRDGQGKVYTVRYEAVNAMLLNEFLKEHRTVQKQQKEIDALKAELKEQRALIQKVNDKMELDRPAPQTVLNNQ
jgi:hypothetical protein